MKKIETADLLVLGASERVVNYYSGSDMIQTIHFDRGKYIVKTMDGIVEYKSAAEMLSDFESLAIEEARILEEIE